MLLKSLIATAHNEFLLIFLGLVLFDFITGYLKAWKWKVTSSDIGTKGVIKHTLTFLFYSIVIFGGYYLNSIFIAQSLLTLVMLTYTTSIIENLGVMGVYVPSFVKNRVLQEIKKYEATLGEMNDEKK